MSKFRFIFFVITFVLFVTTGSVLAQSAPPIAHAQEQYRVSWANIQAHGHGHSEWMTYTEAQDWMARRSRATMASEIYNIEPKRAWPRRVISQVNFKIKSVSGH